VHYVQTGIVASYGTQLLDWLDRYAFPAEMAFADPRMPPPWRRCFATSCYGQRHHDRAGVLRGLSAIVAALFAEAERRGMRIAPQGA